MDRISPLGWVVIAGFLIFVIGLNLSLFLALRKMKNPVDTKLQNNLRMLTNNPWQKEDDQWKELSERVAQLKNLNPPDEGNDPSSRPQ